MNQINTESETMLDPYEALEKGEFQMYLQPKIALQSKQVAGAEALNRWVISKDHILLPDQYLPSFEESGFIKNLDFCMLEQACQYLQQWNQTFPANISPFPIAVNFSKSHFFDQTFLITLEAILKRYRITPVWIEIEITEGMGVSNIKQFKKTVNQLRQNGFLCSIDDFGSYNSSLKLLKEVKIDVLKIDKAFVSGATKHKKTYAILKTIIDLAKTLGIVCVAEGVETKEQLDLLTFLGCDMVQGWYFSKALPQDEFSCFVQKMNA